MAGKSFCIAIRLYRSGPVPVIDTNQFAVPGIGMNKQRFIWVVFTAVSLACAFVAYSFFPKAFPIVSVDISMTRELAIEQARGLSQEHGWGQARSQRDAASFGTNIRVKTFVELEAGGVEGFARLLKDPIFSPYTCLLYTSPSPRD